MTTFDNFVPSHARNPFVVLCCSSCRFLHSVPRPARNIFVKIRVIGYAELKVRGKIYSFRAMRGTPFVVPCCLMLSLLSFLLFFSEPREETLSFYVVLAVVFLSFFSSLASNIRVNYPSFLVGIFTRFLCPFTLLSSNQQYIFR